MAKNHFGKFLAAAVITGAAVAGCVAYFTKYRDFQKSLDEDFNDFEDNSDESENQTEEKAEPSPSPIKREYVSIPLDTPEASDLSDQTDAKADET